jgi:hypothetical protein
MTAVRILFLLFIITQTIIPCTTAIVSGKYTSDGRPLLVKHRDSGYIHNRLMYFEDGDYSYIGLLNSVDSTGTEVWGGSNSAGFAIMNSASYNLKPDDDTTKIKDREGIIMKLALQTCETLEDFEEMLSHLEKPLGVEANFGVIDAHGGCAYYECDNFTFRKIDANDPKVAPFGYIIRTNYSFTGRDDEGYGYIRYLAAEQLFYNAAASNDLSYRFILQDVSRCLKHSLTGTDLTKDHLTSGSKKEFVHFQDYIPRNSSVSTILVQGVREGESPELTTIWTILGFQLCSVAVPVWVAGDSNIPAILAADSSGNAPLCEKALALKDKCFPIKRGSGYKYLNTAAVVNTEGTGILQLLRPVENEIMSMAEKQIKKWRETGKINSEEAGEFYRWTEKFVTNKYLNLFGL